MVGISLLTLVPGSLGGSETYVRELLRGLTRVGVHDYRVLVPPVAPEAGEGLPTDLAAEYRPATTVPQRLLALAAATARPAPLRAHLAAAQVVHFPLTIAVPRVRQPRVVTLHDTQHLDLPQMFPRAERAFRALTWHRSLRSAARVIVLSEFVRERAIARIGLDAARLRVVYSGVDHSLFSPSAGEREPFLFYPARAWPHKNHARLFEAFALLRRRRPELRLVLSGGGDHGALPEGVESRGFVPAETLRDLYRTAAALVFPSLYEGFGQPPLEAMACGCPVTCSNAAALPEIVGAAARLFDPRSPQAIAEAVDEVLDTPAPWIARGLERAARFSWDATARETDAVYAELL